MTQLIRSRNQPDEINSLGKKIENLEITNNDSDTKNSQNDLLAQSLEKNTSSADLTLEKLALEYNSVELKWKSLRMSSTCSETLDNKYI